MKLIKEDSYYKIYWYDTEQTIIVGEVHVGWTWSTAYDGLKILNETIRQRSNEVDVYSIIHFQSGAQLLPKSGSILTNLRNLLNDDPQYEKMTFYVIQTGFLHSMMQIVSRLYGIRHWVERHRFVNTLDEALVLIENDKHFS